MENNDSPIANDNYLLKLKAEKQLRFMITMAIIPVIIGLSTLLYINLSKDIRYSPLYDFVSLLVPTSFALFGIAILMIYLQTGFKRNSFVHIEYSKVDNELDNPKKNIEGTEFASNSDITRLQTQIHELKLIYSNIDFLSNALSSNDKDEIISLLKKDLVENTSNEISEEIIDKIKTNAFERHSASEVELILGRTLERLSSEIQSLTRRGNLNLSLGVVTTIIGLSILGFFVLKTGPVTEDKMAFIANFIPRLSLVILIEVFAYFFLKLYKSSLSEIKYFQNEMTNIEVKLAAVNTSIFHADKGVLANVVHSLSATERNAILEKGQTTVEIEKSRLEFQNTNTISEKISKIIESKKQSG